MKKLFLTLLIITLTSGLRAQQQEFTSMSIGELAKRNQGFLNQTKDNPGAHTFKEFLSFEAVLKEKPRPINKYSKMTLNAFVMTLGLNKKFIGQFTHEIPFEYKGQKFLFFLTGPMADSMKKELQKHTRLSLGVFTGLLNDFSKVHSGLLLRFSVAPAPVAKKKAPLTKK